MKKTENSKAPALTRGLQILELLTQEDGEWNFKAIKERLGIPGPSLWRLVNVLRDCGYILYDQEKHNYRLSLKFLYLGNVILHQAGFRSEVRDYLVKLVNLTGETAELSARWKDELVLLDQVESPDAVRLFSRVGSTYPYFHATAPGKVYLAHMDKDKLERVTQKIGLPSITTFSQTHFPRLKKELNQIKQQGYAIDNQEMRLGVFRIASPIFDRNGLISGCLGIAGPSFRLDKKRGETLGEIVKKVAEELSNEVNDVWSN
jgi:DNA-binding IclR family transcriptional regulator